MVNVVFASISAQREASLSSFIVQIPWSLKPLSQFKQIILLMILMLLLLK